MRMKITSMKRAFILFWHGLTALLVGIANWFTVILGMRDDSKYGKILRRTVGSCFAFLMLLLAIAAGWDFCRTACYRLEVNKHFDGSYYDTQYISRNVTYYTYYDEDGADVSERFRLQTPAQRTAFEQLFIRPHTRTPGVPLRWITPADIVTQQALLRHPDFVVARMKGQYWQVREKVFDYQGRFRRANELR